MRGLLTESALVGIISGKHQFCMPMYRQAPLLHCFCGHISFNALVASVVRVELAMQPVINLMRDHLLDSNLLYGDETTFQMFKEKGPKVTICQLHVDQDERYRIARADVQLYAQARQRAYREAVHRHPMGG